MLWEDSGKSEIRKAVKEKTKEMTKDLEGLRGLCGFFQQKRLKVTVMGCLS